MVMVMGEPMLLEDDAKGEAAGNGEEDTRGPVLLLVGVLGAGELATGAIEPGALDTSEGPTSKTGEEDDKGAGGVARAACCMMR